MSLYVLLITIIHKEKEKSIESFYFYYIKKNYCAIDTTVSEILLVFLGPNVLTIILKYT